MFDLLWLCYPFWGIVWLPTPSWSDYNYIQYNTSKVYLLIVMDDKDDGYLKNLKSGLGDEVW